MRKVEHLVLILAVFWTAFIVYGLTSEPSGMPTFPWLEFKGADKLIHLVLFAIESLLVALTLKARGLTWPIRLTLVWCFVLGGGLEVIQYSYVAGRSGDVWDLLADMLGSVIGLTVLCLIKRD